MQGSIRQLIVDLHDTKKSLEKKLKREKQDKQFISTKLFDARYTIKQQKQLIEKLEKKIDRIRKRRKSKLAKLFRLN